MLKHLSIKNVAVIENAEIDFFKGFTVLTGETGAGKSIVIDSINLIKGERGSKSLIRSGKESLIVSALFETDDEEAQKISEIAGCEKENEIVITRELFKDGRNNIRINGMLSNLTMLKNIGENLISIHGQHDNTFLLSAKSHIYFLDLFGKDEINTHLCEYKKIYEKVSELEREIENTNTDEREKQRRKDMLLYQIEEIENASLYIGEDEELEIKREAAKNFEKISSNASLSYEMLYGSERNTVHDILWNSIKKLESISAYSPECEKIYLSLTDAAEKIDDCSSDLRHFCDGLSSDTLNSDEIEQRLDIISNLKRKYANSTDGILQFCENAKKEYEEIENSDIKKDELIKEKEKEEKEMAKKAEIISSLRKKYACCLSEKIENELKDLNMERAEFKIRTDETSFNKNGKDDVEFMIRTNVGEDMMPLVKIASGGELSRIMLAIKNVINEGGTSTSIFDEIDSGISGIAARKTGQKLLNMSKGNQVICITHLPQISSLADNHYLIEKKVKNDKTYTEIRSLSKDERVEEIAKVIGAGKVSEAAKENARQLIRRYDKKISGR